ncbi:MAG: aldo/keto reductase [Candidatus Latescibacteria bacterium]|nr:aldo/keto reductase [Candidatus Latescibacterota bacterium]
MNRRNFIKDIGLSTSVLSLSGCGAQSVQQLNEISVPSGTMPMKKLGKTSIDISLLGFGAHLKEELVRQPKLRDRMIKLGYEGGINLFDVYNRDEYRQYKPMSKSIREFRKNIILSLYAINGTKKLISDVEYALKTFKTDYIDLYRFRPVNDTSISIMEKYKQEGKIRALGVAAHSAEILTKYINTYGGSIDYIFVIYNFHHGRFIMSAEKDDSEALINRCKRDGIGIIGMKPMGSDAMIKFAHERGYFNNNGPNIAQSMLRYVYRRQEINAAVTAMNTIDEVLLNLKAVYSPTISENEIEKLQTLSRKASEQKGAYLPKHYQWLESWV